MRRSAAWPSNREQGFRTRDVPGDEGAVGPNRFTDAVIANLGKSPANTRVRQHRALQVPDTKPIVPPKSRRTLGLDVFVETTRSPAELGPVPEQLLTVGDRCR